MLIQLRVVGWIAAGTGPMATSFTLEGKPRSDGLVRFTCDGLPGFRLLLKAREDKSSYNDDLKEAIVAFLPIFFAAETRSKSEPHARRDLF